MFKEKTWYHINETLTFIKKMFFTAMTFFSCNTLKYVSMNNQECKIRQEIININGIDPLSLQHSFK